MQMQVQTEEPKVKVQEVLPGTRALVYDYEVALHAPAIVVKRYGYFS